MHYKLEFQDKYKEVQAIRIKVGESNYTLTEVEGRLNINKWCDKLSEEIKLVPKAGNSFSIE